MLLCARYALLLLYAYCQGILNTVVLNVFAVVLKLLPPDVCEQLNRYCYKVLEYVRRAHYPP